MLSLKDPNWQHFIGGYQVPYDASGPLLKLQEAADAAVIAGILDELWEELHHQGDIGTASPLAVPQLIRIGIEQQITDWRLIGLVALIEIQRSENVKLLPKQYEAEYSLALQQVVALLAVNKALPWEETYAACALAALSTSKGQLAMARVIQELSDPDLTEKFEEFLANY